MILQSCVPVNILASSPCSSDLRLSKDGKVLLSFLLEHKSLNTVYKIEIADRGIQRIHDEKYDKGYVDVYMTEFNVGIL